MDSGRGLQDLTSRLAVYAEDRIPTEFFLAKKRFATLKSYFSRDAIQNWGNGFRLLKMLDTYFSNFPILSCNIGSLKG